MHNLGRQEVRLIHDNIPKQRIKDNKLWIYHYLNAPENDWNSFYSFAELEFFQEDFEVLNLWGSAKTLHPWTVLVVRFLRPCGRVKVFGSLTTPASSLTTMTSRSSEKSCWWAAWSKSTWEERQVSCIPLVRKKAECRLSNIISILR